MKDSIIKHYQRKARNLEPIILDKYSIRFSVNPSLRYITAEVRKREGTKTGSLRLGYIHSKIEALGPKEMSLKIGRQLSDGDFKNDKISKVPDPMYRKDHEFWFA